MLDPTAPKWQEFLATKEVGTQNVSGGCTTRLQDAPDPQFQMAKETKTVLICASLHHLAHDLIRMPSPFLGLLDDVLVAGLRLGNWKAELERYRHHPERPRGLPCGVGPNLWYGLATAHGVFRLHLPS